MRLQTVIWPSLNSNTNTFSFALFRVNNSLFNGCRAVPTQSIMQIPHKVISIVLGEAHKSATHTDELHFISVVPQSL